MDQAVTIGGVLWAIGGLLLAAVIIGGFVAFLSILAEGFKH